MTLLTWYLETVFKKILGCLLLWNCDTCALHKSNSFQAIILTTESNFDVLLTVHLSTILVNDQLDAQFFYFIMRLLQSSTRFEQRRAHHQEVKLY